MHYRVPSSIFEKHTYCTKIVNYLQKLLPSAKLPGRRTNLPRRGRVDDGPYLGDPVGREAPTLGMLANQLLVRRQVHTIDLVVGHEALHPLDLRTELLQHAAGLLGDPLQCFRRQAACSREFTLDHKLVHRFLLELSFRFRTGLAPSLAGRKSPSCWKALFLYKWGQKSGRNASILSRRRQVDHSLPRRDSIRKRDRSGRPNQTASRTSRGPQHARCWRAGVEVAPDFAPHQANCGLDVGPDRHRTLTSWPEPSANWDFTSISAVQLV